MIIFFADLLTKLFILMIDLASRLFVTEEKKAANKFIEAILKGYIIKNHFIKNIAMHTEDGERF